MPSAVSAPPADRRAPRPARAPIAVSVLVVGFALLGAACLPPPSPPAGFTGDVAAAVNRDRGAAGLAPLAWNAQLATNAQNWANHLAATGALVHTDLATLMQQPSMAGWWSLGENLFEGSGNPSAAVTEATWMGSAEHRANILSPSWNFIGVGAARDSSGRVWVVAEFGAR